MEVLLLALIGVELAFVIYLLLRLLSRFSPHPTDPRFKPWRFWMDTVIGLLIVIVVVGFIAYKKVPAFKDAVDALKDKVKKKPEAVEATNVAPVATPPPVPAAPAVPVGTTTPIPPNVPAEGQSYEDWWNKLPAQMRSIYPAPSDAAFRDQQMEQFRRNQSQQLTAVDGQIVPTPGEFNVTGGKITVHSTYKGHVHFSISAKGQRPNMAFVTVNGQTFSGVNGYVENGVNVDGPYTLVVEHSEPTTSWVVLLAQ